MITTLTCLSPAKLNLFLHITGRRDDGRHNLQTVFQLLDWGDEMRFERQNSQGCTLDADFEGVAPEENLILRAASLLMPQDPSMGGVRISIKKHIPMGGGLGGGSSNAATTLLALNQLFGLGHDEETLAGMGLKLGADVPVFVLGRSAWGEGVGELLTPFTLPEDWFVILRPDCHVSTADIFNAPELTRNTAPITMSAAFKGGVHNDLQTVVEMRHPEVRNALKLLSNSAPAMMTGSGACVFAQVDTQTKALDIAAKVPESLAPVVARGVNYRPQFVAEHD
ncbi:MAG: 4-(cytidine 5'-diphospho)-2-C-methyl-D-erythritol kinase [Luminiphilus sp.]|jgi:4-diphosphocytidyl-2-C-methyl-D-erythritol kinase|nr:4-(cytidine 5'-diphospho)-2-C-methyl-D-erythritol kinase [Luminiphilus sp.]